MTDDVALTLAEAFDLARSALQRLGMSEQAARALSRATVDAEAAGRPAVGFAHLADYLKALAEGRIDGRAEPLVTAPVPAVMKCDAMGGVAQYGFEIAREELAAKARTFGLSVFAAHNSYTTGELGWYAGRLAEDGLVALAATNAPAMVAAAGGSGPVYGTNPLAFAAPLSDGRILLVDQATSATAFVNIRAAAARGEPIPEGWALDEGGRPTIDPLAALKGALLAFGGARGANIALMVEVLAAGLTGANWSLDAPDFLSGSASPGCGLFVLALAPQVLAENFAGRLTAQAERLSRHGVHVPGLARTEAKRQAESRGIVLPRQLFDSISSFRRNQP
ncbi:Ldh family oxidoreductase [Shinella pollutisoli]|uniref:Ldh family oxidoreductase n=1 Tax=Shinella pollutisoli TaxID=2250594 RepID=A0ABV7DK71_9HYPH|nr:Ldh family oxidoreductase [Shinella pollutisoli]